MDDPRGDENERADRVAALLAGGVPLTLLADLAESDGPVSPAILEAEGLPDDAWWEEGDEGTGEAGEESDADAPVAGETESEAAGEPAGEESEAGDEAPHTDGDRVSR